MPAKDIYHENVKNALIKDGWTITFDPFKLKWGLRDLFVDLAVQKIITAKKEKQLIAVEIKSFHNPSPVADLEQALGQYIIYSNVLEETQRDCLLYLAIRQSTYSEIFTEPLGNLIIQKNHIRLIIFNPKTEEITQWIH